MKNKMKLISMMIIAGSVAVVILAIVLYSFFISGRIFEESSVHLEEIYDQVGDTFNQKISDYKNVMHSWENYIVDVTENSNGAKHEEFKEFIEDQKQNWGFTRFCFINVKDPDSSTGAEIKLTDGTVSTLNLRRNASVLLDRADGGVIVRETGVDGEIGSRYLMFATPIGDGSYTYDGFEYDAIGIAFRTEDIQESIKIDSFNNEGTYLIVLPDEEGNVLLQSGTGERVEKFIPFLSNYGSFSMGVGLTEIRNGFKKIEEASNDKLKEIEAETTLFTFLSGINDAREYYLTYKPIGFSDWILCGLVPSSVLNSNMTNLHVITIIVICVIFVIAFACVIYILVMINNKRVKGKELEVKSRESILDLLTQNSSDIFVLFNGDYTSEYVSTNVNKILDLDIGEIKKDVRNILLAVDGENPIALNDIFTELRQTEQWTSDVSMKSIVGENKYTYRAIINHSVNDKKDSYVMMLSDRTKERRMSANLSSALDIARSANKAKSNFLANMSHDIRTPMNAIIGFSTLCAKDADKPDKVREYIRKISFSSQHLLSLINDILDMSKIESGKSSLNMVEFNLPDLLEEQYTMMLPQTRAKKQTFDVKAKGYLPELVYGDKMRINQILLNLLSNAVKYTPENGNILLQVESVDKSLKKNTHLRISVKDDGMGMSKEFVDIIFEPFSRESTVATREIQGTGLGMAITKQIVELMGGTISVESEPGKGSTFTVDLELTVVSDAENDEHFWKNHEIFKVLVVDDEEDICVEVKELMSETGVEVDYALGGMEAVDKIAEHFETDNAYNVVLLDWKMPGMDGVETAKCIREKVGKDLPIIILTSYNFDEIEEEARSAGIDLFLTKPFFISNFRHAVSQLNGKAENKESEEEKKETSPLSLKGMNILAAEDNDINAEILQELLDIEGANCIIASNGKEALETFEKSAKGTYDMIFMDVQMPVMNGYEATRAIRACAHPEAKTIPILAMTANAFEDDVKTALDAGMNAHLAKPIDMLKLKVIVAELRGESDGR